MLKASAPTPRIGVVEKPVCDGATDPGTSSPRSVKWRPFSGISCRVSRRHHVSDGGRRAIDQRRVRTDHDRLGLFAHDEDEIADLGTTDLEIHRLDDLRAKPGRPRPDGVSTGGNGENPIQPFAIGEDGQRELGCVVEQANQGARDHGTGFVSDAPLENRGRLPLHHAGKKAQRDEHRERHRVCRDLPSGR